ncbi:G-protein coupled receptor 143-like [Leptodactylus fuscus]|uniref:G-protein coupled receptor 143-like n=1 Tax=Leptodactylus fuscus TaxID=238119 RepID=UPI003F4E83D4
MASLRLPRLCCPERDPGTDLVLGSERYHAICGASAFLGLISLAICYKCCNRRQSRAISMGWRILLASTFVTSGLLLHSTLCLMAPDFLSSQSWFSHFSCVFISTWIHFFCAVLFWAFFCYSLEIDQLFKPNPSERFGLLYSILCWGGSSLICLHGLLMLVVPSKFQNRCDSMHGLVQIHDVLLYIPLLMALLGSPYFLRRAIVGVPVLLKMQSGVYTSCERHKKQTLLRRLFQIFGTFIACWLGNVLGDFLLLLVEVSDTSEPPRQLQMAAFTTFVMMGILNPMFCCVHSLAFFGWRSSDAYVTQSSTVTETPSGTREDPATEQQKLLSRPRSIKTSGKPLFPNVVQLMDSCSSADFTCSPVEINAVRLLGAQDSPVLAEAGSKF